MNICPDQSLLSIILCLLIGLCGSFIPSGPEDTEMHSIHPLPEGVRRRGELSAEGVLALLVPETRG